MFQTATATANANYQFPVIPGKRYVLEVSGYWGGAGSVTVAYNSPGGDIAAIAAFTANKSAEVVTAGEYIKVTLTGATSPNLTIRLAPIH